MIRPIFTIPFILALIAGAIMYIALYVVFRECERCGPIYQAAPRTTGVVQRFDSSKQGVSAIVRLDDGRLVRAHNVSADDYHCKRSYGDLRACHGMRMTIVLPDEVHSCRAREDRPGWHPPGPGSCAFWITPVLAFAQFAITWVLFHFGLRWTPRGGEIGREGAR
jgi:hypothetical protein